MKHIQVIMLTLLAVVLGACAVMEPPEAPSSGMVRISIADNKHRAIIPTEPDEFTKYSFDFEPVDGQGAVPQRQWLENGETEIEVGLMPGNWVITATGYAHISGYEAQNIADGDYPAARGTARILVRHDETNDVSITLEGGVQPDEQGVLEWDVTLPSSAYTMFLEVWTLGGEPVLNEDLIEACSGSSALDAGFYLLILRINGGALRTDALHIYGGTVSVFEWELRFDDLDKLALYLGGMPVNTPDTPYNVKLESNFSLDDLTIYDVYNSNLNDPRFARYINLDLSECTGDMITDGDGFISMFNRPYITGITYSANVTSMETNAFQYLPGLREIDLSNTNITELPQYRGYTPFRNLANLKRVTLPDSLKTISGNMFLNCTSLTEINLPDGLTTIDGSVFENCTSLTEITLPDSVTSIGAGIFGGCTNLAEINLPNGLTRLDGMFSGCTSLAEITLPDGLTYIGGGAFSGCTSLTEITLPDGVTFIGNNAFQNCTSLTEINLPNGLTTIGSNAFQNCTSLVEIDMSTTNVTIIPGGIFYNCTNLADVKLPSVLTDLGDFYNIYYAGAFQNCAGLMEITIPSGVTTIGSSAFRNSGLTRIDLPSSVTRIGNNAFLDTSLADIDLSILYNITAIGEGAFENCASLERVTLPHHNLTTLPQGMFRNCASLAEINLLTITTIGSGAFENCANLERVFFSSDRLTIGVGAFRNCTSLREVDLSLWSIQNSTFEGCANLEKIIINNSDRVASGINADNPVFYGTPASMKIYVPDNLVSGYLLKISNPNGRGWWVLSSQIFPMSALN